MLISHNKWSKQEMIIKFKLSYNTLGQLIMTINTTNSSLVTFENICTGTLCAHGLGAFWVRIDNENLCCIFYTDMHSRLYVFSGAPSAAFPN